MTYAQTTCKKVLIKEMVIPKVEYNLIDDLKRAKANISLFELLKISSVREGLPKNMVLNRSIEAQNHNLEVCTNLDSQKYATKKVPPFLLTFNIFNRNVLKCMTNLGAYSNVIPVSVCKNLNAAWESFLHR